MRRADLVGEAWYATRSAEEARRDLAEGGDPGAAIQAERRRQTAVKAFMQASPAARIPSNSMVVSGAFTPDAAKGGLLIDVREADEFEKEHAAGAKHLSRGVLEMKIEEAAPDLDQPIVCYCGGGKRSALAAENLQRMGYTNVASLTGGFKAWKAAGFAVE